MTPEITLTPEELYYLGKLLKARYIDYAYIAAMKDIQQNAEASKQDAQRDLTQKGYLIEDFSGEVEIDDDLRKLLGAVLLGDFESSLSVCEIGEKTAVTSARFHIADGLTVLTTMGDGEIHLSEFDDDQLKQLVASLLPPGYLAKEMKTGQTVTKDSIRRVLVFKNTHVGEKAEVKVYFESDGWICFDGGDRVSVVEGSYFCDDAYRILKGV